MAYTDGQKTSAELEREVNAQRDRVEARIGEIKERLSPGQIVDELLSYSGEGGSKFATNLGHQLTANPLPAALVGVGLAWLIGSSVNANAAATPAPRAYRDDDEFPYARLPSGGLRRVSHSADEDGQWWTEFESNEGTRYKAEADSLGRRAGHFTDQAGKKFSGFIDDTGNRVRHFQDESGNVLDGAMGWASHAWQDTQKGLGQRVHDLQHAASDTAAGAISGARNLGSSMGGGLQSQTDQLTRQISSLFDQQPLIAGALAFAAGAALGAALPHTAAEDQVLGEQADKVRDQATAAAGDLYEQGKDKAADLYHDAAVKAADVYGNAKDTVAGLSQGTKGSAPN